MINEHHANDAELNRFKFIFIGDSAVGKTTLLIRFITQKFAPLDSIFWIYDAQKDGRLDKNVVYKDTPFKLSIQDTAGQQRYWSIVCTYLKSIDAAVLIFSLQDDKSLKVAEKRMQVVVNRCGNEMPKILLGNKSDLLTPEELQQKLQKLEIRALQKKYNCQYFTVSAKSGEGLSQAFEYLAFKVKAHKQANISQSSRTPSFRLNSLTTEDTRAWPQPKRKCC